MDSANRRRLKAAGIQSAIAAMMGAEPSLNDWLERDIPKVVSDRYGNRTKYHQPHQGPRECERRRRQMAAGTHGY